MKNYIPACFGPVAGKFYSGLQTISLIYAGGSVTLCVCVCVYKRWQYLRVYRLARLLLVPLAAKTSNEGVFVGR